MLNFVTFYNRHFDWSGAEWRNLVLCFVGDFSTPLHYARNDKKGIKNEEK